MLEGGEAIGTYLDRFKALRGLWERYEKGALPKEKQADRSTCRSYWVASREQQDAVAAVFTRDPETALTVWSAEVGYPGDGWYLDFHKKHFPGGLKYWRVTRAKSDLAEKEIYEPWRIEDRLSENADHFVNVVKKRLKNHFNATGEPGHITAPFDTELFGHWWFEGPGFLERVLDRLAKDPEVELVSCGEKLASDPPREVISLPEGSWGQGGFHWIWLNEDTEWTWPKIYECEEILGNLKSRAKEPKGSLKRTLDQAARELLLLQASDWQFLISTWSARDYAELRFSEHYGAFKRLANIAADLIKKKQATDGDLCFLEEISQRDSLFPDLELDDWQG
jgi:1,4-alpha-glucan branching enzyme